MTGDTWNKTCSVTPVSENELDPQVSVGTGVEDRTAKKEKASQKAMPINPTVNTLIGETLTPLIFLEFKKQKESR